MFGYCYTQLTDIDQEQNGIYKYDRSPKFDLVKIRNAQSQPAAIEQLEPKTDIYTYMISQSCTGT